MTRRYTSLSCDKTSDLLTTLLSLPNLLKIQEKVEDLVKKVHTKPIILEIETIRQAIQHIYYTSFQHSNGDVYSRYHMQKQSMTNTIEGRIEKEKIINEKTIKILYDHVRNYLFEKYKYDKFSIWTSENDKTKTPELKLKKDKVISTLSFEPRF